MLVKEKKSGKNENEVGTDDGSEWGAIGGGEEFQKAMHRKRDRDLQRQMLVERRHRNKFYAQINDANWLTDRR